MASTGWEGLYSEVRAGAAAGAARLPSLAAISGAFLFAAAWALLSPPIVLSFEMTWDLLFALAGAWHRQAGQIQHADFHEPVGALNFLLTEFGFLLVGPSPRAFIAGSVVMAAIICAAAVAVAWRRLPLVAAALFVAFVTLMALMPANIGDPPRAYSFAMSYNRYGWSLLGVIALAVFQPPRSRGTGGMVEMAIVAGLAVMLFHLKLTYFMVAVGAIGLAIMVSPHMRDRAAGWTAVCGLLVLNAVAPHNWDYLDDVARSAAAGGLRTGFRVQLDKLVFQPVEVAIYASAFAFTVWLWLSCRAPLRLPAAVGFVVAAGIALLTQNAQAHGLPLGLVIVFLIYGHSLDAAAPRPTGLSPFDALLVVPLFCVGATALCIANYHLDATSPGGLWIVEETRLQGLAVRSEDDGLLAAFNEPGANPALLNRARARAPRYELSPFEYVATLIEAAQLFPPNEGPPGEIVLLDQVNPLPFMLGAPPPHGGNLWSGLGAPSRPAAQLFGAAAHVLIPKFSTYGRWTDGAVALYGPYIAEHFPRRIETTSWIKYSRDPAPAVATGPDP